MCGVAEKPNREWLGRQPCSSTRGKPLTHGSGTKGEDGVTGT